MDFVITQPPLADGPDHEYAWALQAHMRLQREELVRIHGNDDLDNPMSQAYMRASSPFNECFQWLATSPDGEVLGALDFYLPKFDNTHMAFAYIVVEPFARRHGIGSALFDIAAATVTERGRSVMMSFSDHTARPPGPDDEVMAESGTGSISGSEASTAFALSKGFVLEQAERHGVLDLPVPPALLAELAEQSAQHAGDYRLISWEGACPEEFVEAFARMREAMSVDAPNAGLDLAKETWDVDRVRLLEKRLAESGSDAITVVAQHLATGELAGYSTVVQPQEKPAVVYQQDTLVLRKHRGHRLGLAIKTEVCRLIGQTWPHAERVHTWNAAENEHMLAINEALGFRTASLSAAWQKRFAPPIPAE